MLFHCGGHYVLLANTKQRALYSFSEST
ncbi:hypothetical protein OESDEN_18083 [Oesophagostomum dentatum]|uniref:FERM domain-containing protein n=1 Tax=Oesophagostomum dentatum TaxID=61180 RepID=A0A0B1SGB8_OESDE|nr:hypothetical protein OESDEN_18083 [Oesophagostomum dentatum]